MRLPERERVIYSSNPLVEVICQIRFPRDLGIESKVPVDFQRQIREDYPLLEVRNVIDLGLAQQAPGEEPEIVHRSVYDFLTVEKDWKVSLGTDFLSLTCSDYERWESFRERIANLTRTLTEIYQPPVLTRVGLRYRDLIVRGDLGLEKEPWRNLLSSHVIGFLTDATVTEEDVASYDATASLAVDAGTSTIRHGLARHKETKEVAYLIDCDFYTDENTKPDLEVTLELLNKFNRHAGNMFRWCISDKLHQALGPTPVET